MPLTATTAAILSAGVPDAIARSLGLASYAKLARLIYPEPRYKEFLLRKKSGSFRTIASPSPLTKAVQRQLADALKELDASRPSAHGFLTGRSVATNAAAHAFGSYRKTFVFNIDLKDFFSSITFKRVRGIFQAPPFDFSFSKATIFAHLCCYKGALPQGAPTSPALSNYSCRRLDGALQRLARDCRATYTRYADDITFSFSCRNSGDLPARIVDLSSGRAQVGDELRRIIEENELLVNEEKVYLRSRHQRMEVTGLAINDGPNVRRGYIEEIRGALNAWSKYGLTAAQAEFAKRPYKRLTRTGAHPDLSKFLRGKLLYLAMAKGVTDRVYVRLARRFNACVQATTGCKTALLPALPTVVDESEIGSAVFLLSARNAVSETKSTAFFLHEVGIVTCEHCLLDEHGVPFGPADELFLQDIYETDLAALEVVWRDKAADVAVLKPKMPLSIPHLWIPPTAVPPAMHDPAKLVGFPAFSPGKPMTSTPATILQRYSSWARQHLDISALIRKGNSGGPLLDQDLRVIGVAKEGATQEKGNNAVLAISEVLDLHRSRMATASGPKPALVTTSSSP